MWELSNHPENKKDVGTILVQKAGNVARQPLGGWLSIHLQILWTQTNTGTIRWEQVSNYLHIFAQT